MKKDGEINLRNPSDQEIAEYRISNWNSMIDPCAFPPTILHPAAKDWDVVIRIHNAADGDAGPVITKAHPKTDLQLLAKKVETLMGYTGRGPCPRIMFLQNGQVIRSRNPGQDSEDYSMTIASCMLQTPVQIIWTEQP